MPSRGFAGLDMQTANDASASSFAQGVCKEDLVVREEGHRTRLSLVQVFWCRIDLVLNIPHTSAALAATFAQVCGIEVLERHNDHDHD